MLRRFRTDAPLAKIMPVTSPEEILELISAVRDIHVGVAVEDYLLQLVRRSRQHDNIEVGASPRAALALERAAQARAAIAGRGYVIPDDVREMASSVLSHRIMPTAQADLLGKSNIDLIADVIANTPVPVESMETV